MSPSAYADALPERVDFAALAHGVWAIKTSRGLLQLLLTCYPMHAGGKLMSGRRTQPLSVMPMLSATRGTMTITSRCWTRMMKLTTRTWTPSWAKAAQNLTLRKSGRYETLKSTLTQDPHKKEWWGSADHGHGMFFAKLHKAAGEAVAGQWPYQVYQSTLAGCRSTKATRR